RPAPGRACTARRDPRDDRAAARGALGATRDSSGGRLIVRGIRRRLILHRSHRGAYAVSPRSDRAARAADAARALLPSRADYRETPRTWRGDLIAGVTVGIVALPLALAFG